MPLPVRELAKLWAAVEDFEGMAKAEVAVTIRTNGRVVMSIHTSEDDATRTVKFQTISEAIRFFDE